MDDDPVQIPFSRQTELLPRLLGILAFAVMTVILVAGVYYLLQ